MNFRFDFTTSNLVVCDIQNGDEKKNHYFLKKFPQINYSLQHLEFMSQERMIKFFNYLNNKNIIFIINDNNSLEKFEQYLIYFLTNKSNIIIQNIYVLNNFRKSNNQDNNNLNNYLEHLSSIVEEDILYDFCLKILISVNDIRSTYINNNNSNINNGYIFVSNYPHSSSNKNNNSNKLDINYICNQNLEENDIILNFFSKFKIFYILNFRSSGNHSKIIDYYEGKRIKINNEEKKSRIKQINISINKDISNQDLSQLIQNEFMQVIEELKIQIIQNNCILIELDENIEEIFQLELLYIIIHKITELNFDDISEYLKLNFFKMKIDALNVSDKEKILNFFS
jgi:hypothetical protein